MDLADVFPTGYHTCVVASYISVHNVVMYKMLISAKKRAPLLSTCVHIPAREVDAYEAVAEIRRRRARYCCMRIILLRNADIFMENTALLDLIPQIANILLRAYTDHLRVRPAVVYNAFTTNAKSALINRLSVQK